MLKKWIATFWSKVCSMIDPHFILRAVAVQSFVWKYSHCIFHVLNAWLGCYCLNSFQENCQIIHLGCHKRVLEATDKGWAYWLNTFVWWWCFLPKFQFLQALTKLSNFYVVFFVSCRFYFDVFQTFSDNASHMVREIRSDASIMAIANGTFSVDTFFFLSGLLVTFLGLKHINKTKGNINVPLMYLQRYLRYEILENDLIMAKLCVSTFGFLQMLFLLKRYCIGKDSKDIVSHL